MIPNNSSNFSTWINQFDWKKLTCVNKKLKRVFKFFRFLSFLFSSPFFILFLLLLFSQKRKLNFFILLSTIFRFPFFLPFLFSLPFFLLCMIPPSFSFFTSLKKAQEKFLPFLFFFDQFVILLLYVHLTSITHLWRFGLNFSINEISVPSERKRLKKDKNKIR